MSGPIPPASSSRRSSTSIEAGCMRRHERAERFDGARLRISCPCHLLSVQKCPIRRRRESGCRRRGRGRPGRARNAGRIAGRTRLRPRWGARKPVSTAPTRGSAAGEPTRGSAPRVRPRSDRTGDRGRREPRVVTTSNGGPTIVVTAGPLSRSVPRRQQLSDEGFWDSSEGAVGGDLESSLHWLLSRRLCRSLARLPVVG